MSTIDFPLRKKYDFTQIDLLASKISHNAFKTLFNQIYKAGQKGDDNVLKFLFMNSTAYPVVQKEVDRYIDMLTSVGDLTKTQEDARIWLIHALREFFLRNKDERYSTRLLKDVGKLPLVRSNKWDFKIPDSTFANALHQIHDAGDINPLGHFFTKDAMPKTRTLFEAFRERLAKIMLGNDTLVRKREHVFLEINFRMELLENWEDEFIANYKEDPDDLKEKMIFDAYDKLEELDDHKDSAEYKKLKGLLEEIGFKITFPFSIFPSSGMLHAIKADQKMVKKLTTACLKAEKKTGRFDVILALFFKQEAMPQTRTDCHVFQNFLSTVIGAEKIPAVVGALEEREKQINKRYESWNHMKDLRRVPDVLMLINQRLGSLSKFVTTNPSLEEEKSILQALLAKFKVADEKRRQEEREVRFDDKPLVKPISRISMLRLPIPELRDRLEKMREDEETALLGFFEPPAMPLTMTEFDDFETRILQATSGTLLDVELIKKAIEAKKQRISKLFDPTKIPNNEEDKYTLLSLLNRMLNRLRFYMPSDFKTSEEYRKIREFIDRVEPDIEEKEEDKKEEEEEEDDEGVPAMFERAIEQAQEEEYPLMIEEEDLDYKHHDEAPPMFEQKTRMEEPDDDAPPMFEEDKTDGSPPLVVRARSAVKKVGTKTMDLDLTKPIVPFKKLRTFFRDKMPRKENGQLSTVSPEFLKNVSIRIFEWVRDVVSFLSYTLVDNCERKTTVFEPEIRSAILLANTTMTDAQLNHGPKAAYRVPTATRARLKHAMVFYAEPMTTFRKEVFETMTNALQWRLLNLFKKLRTMSTTHALAKMTICPTLSTRGDIPRNKHIPSNFEGTANEMTVHFDFADDSESSGLSDSDLFDSNQDVDVLLQDDESDNDDFF